MVNREKVLHGLNSCGFCDGVPNICEVTECPYRGNKGWCVHELAHDAGMLISELMEEQDAVGPTEPDEDNMKYCGACGSPVGYEVLETSGIEYVQYRYCPNCGRAVKWK